MELQDEPTKQRTDAERERIKQELNAAKGRLGDPKSMLQWCIDFVDEEVKTRSESERVTISWNLRAIADRAGHSWANNDVFTPFSLPFFIKLQREFAHTLLGIFSQSAYASVTGPEKIAIGRVSPLGAKQTELVTIFYTKKPFRSIMHGFVNLVWTTGQHLRQCRRKACNKPFVINTKRQEYCTLNCSQIERNERKKREKKKPK